MGAKNYYVAIKAEPVSIGVPDVTVTAAKKMRLNAITAPHLAQALIEDPEIRSDGLTSMPRLGTQAGDATLPAALRWGEQDPYLEAALRSAFATDVLVPGLTRRSYTLETYEQDIDTSVLSKGGRFGGFRLTGAPDEPAMIEFPFMFIKQEVLASGASPFYTAPTVGTTEMMVCTDAAIEIDDVPVLNLTAFDFTVGNGLSLAKVVGSPYSPDVYEGNFTLGGSVSAIRSSAARQSAYLAGTPFKYAVTFSDRLGNLMAFRFPNFLAADFTLPMGNDGPPVSTIPVRGGVVGTDALIEIERTAAA